MPTATRRYFSESSSFSPKLLFLNMRNLLLHLLLLGQVFGRRKGDWMIASRLELVDGNIFEVASRHLSGEKNVELCEGKAAGLWHPEKAPGETNDTGPSPEES